MGARTVEEVTRGSEENPPGYYSTVERPDPGGALPEPIGPGTRLAAKLVGIAFLLAAVVFAVIQLVSIAANPVAFTASPRFVTGRWVAFVVLPLFFGLLGVVLLRHADDRPTPLLRKQFRRSR